MSLGSDNKRIVKNTAFLYIRMLVVMCISIYSSRVILNTLGVVDYGIYNVVAGFVTMFSFLNSSFTASIQRFYNFEKGRNGDIGFTNVYITSIYIQIILALIILLFTETIGLWYVKNKMVIPFERLDSALFVFHLAILQMIILVLQVPFSSAIVANERMNFYAKMSIFDVVCRLVIIFVLPILPYDKLKSYALLSLVISLLNFSFYVIYSKANFSYLRYKRIFDRGLFKSMISFSGWNIFGAMSLTLRNQGVSIILNLFYGPVVNAARSLSFQIQSAILGFANNITTAVRPQLVESYARGNYTRSKSLMFGMSKLCYVILLLFVLPISIEINYILSLWLGKVPEYTSQFAIIILCTALIDITNAPVSMIVLATGRVSKFNITSSIIGLSLLPISYYILSLGYSPVLVYVATLLVSFFIQVASLKIMSNITRIQISDYLRLVVKPIILITISSFAIPLYISHCLNESFLRLFAVTATSTIIIIITSFLFGMTNIERGVVISFIKERIK